MLPDEILMPKSLCLKQSHAQMVITFTAPQIRSVQPDIFAVIAGLLNNVLVEKIKSIVVSNEPRYI